MNNAIVTTTIQPPTEATLKFCKLSNWDLIVVGDLKTPKNDLKNNSKYSIRKTGCTFKITTII